LKRLLEAPDGPLGLSWSLLGRFGPKISVQLGFENWTSEGPKRAKNSFIKNHKKNILVIFWYIFALVVDEMLVPKIIPKLVKNLLMFVLNFGFFWGGFGALWVSLGSLLGSLEALLGGPWTQKP